MFSIPDPFPGLDWSSRNTFGRNGLDRRSEDRPSQEAVDAAFADPRMRLMLFLNDRILMKSGKPARPYVTNGEARELLPSLHTRLLLGRDADGSPWFAAEFKSEPELEPGEYFTDLRAMALDAGADTTGFGPAAQARAMLFWHKRNAFCGACGAPTESTSAGYQRNCTACGTQHFPRTDPVVIMLIVDGDRALLGRTPRFEAGMYTCLAGFMEPGETMEDAVRREVREESGIDVGRVVYHSSQPWPFPANLMLGCYGEAASTTIKIDRTEMEDCRWFTRAEVRAMLAASGVGVLHCPPKLAVARVLIEAWAYAD